MNKKTLILISLLFFPVQWGLASPSLNSVWSIAEEEKWAESKEWLALLHYRRTAFLLFRSGIDSPEFFLSSKGRVSPEEELKATLTAFLTPSSFEETACRFPARAYWLRQQKKVSLPPQPACERFESWRKKLAPDGVSLVFASYYFNNPASMYGHTFLKLHRSQKRDSSGLLDYTVNYAAITNTSNGVLFALRGLTGLYKGKFSTDPYYFKIQKYNNIESRDLWEYELDFSKEELDQLVRHLWELGPAWARYYFFNRNCSYELLPLIDAIKPNLHLSSAFQYRAIPLDTLKRVVETPSLLKKIRHRPSRSKILLAKASQLTKQEIKIAKKIAKEPELKKLDSFSERKQAQVISLALDFWRKKVGHLRDLPDDERKKERSLLLRLNELPQIKPIEISKENPPHLAHGTLQMRASFGADKDEPFWELGIRPALHDLNSSPQGFIEGSQLKMLDLTLRHRYRKGQLYFKDFTLIDIFSLTPWKSALPAPSWNIHAGFETPDDLFDRRLSGTFRGGSGLTKRLSILEGVYVYAMAQGEVAQGPAYRDGYRAGGGGTGGLWVLFHPRARFLIQATALRFGAGNPGNVVRFKATQTFDIFSSGEARLEFSRANGYSEGRISFVLNR